MPRSNFSLYLSVIWCYFSVLENSQPFPFIYCFCPIPFFSHSGTLITCILDFLVTSYIPLMLFSIPPNSFPLCSSVLTIFCCVSQLSVSLFSCVYFSVNMLCWVLSFSYSIFLKLPFISVLEFLHFYTFYFYFLECINYSYILKPDNSNIWVNCSLFSLQRFCLGTAQNQKCSAPEEKMRRTCPGHWSRPFCCSCCHWSCWYIHTHTHRHTKKEVRKTLLKWVSLPLLSKNSNSGPK